MMTKAGEQPTITQADIDAAKLYLQGIGPWKLEEIGICHDDPLVEAFAKHRTTSLAAQDGLVEALEAIEQTPNYRCCAADMRKIARKALSAIKGDKS